MREPAVEEPTTSAAVIYLPPSCRRACALAAARALSFQSSCCRWCSPSSVHLDNCGRKLTVQNGLPASQDWVFRTEETEIERKDFQLSPDILSVLEIILHTFQFTVTLYSHSTINSLYSHWNINKVKEMTVAKPSFWYQSPIDCCASNVIIFFYYLH